MYILGWDTSTLRAVLALFSIDSNDTPTLVRSAVLNAEARHSENLLYEIDKILSEAKLTLSQLHGFAIGIGPGSFTGLRIGIATARGLTLGHPHLKILPFSSLEALKYSALGESFKHSKNFQSWCMLSQSTKTEVYFRLEQNDETVEGSSNYESALSKIESISPSPKIIQSIDIQWPNTLTDRLSTPPLISDINAVGIATLSCEILKNRGFSEPSTLLPNYARLSEPERRRLGLLTS